MKSITNFVYESAHATPMPMNEGVKKPKMVKVYRITDHYSPMYSGKDREYKAEGSLAELIQYYSYTLECGKSYENERGNKKINMEPKNIKALCDNLEKASNNSARNGYSGHSYSWEEIGEKELVLPNPESAAAEA